MSAKANGDENGVASETPGAGPSRPRMGKLPPVPSLIALTIEQSRRTRRRMTETPVSVDLGRVTLRVVLMIDLRKQKEYVELEQSIEVRAF